MTLTRTQRANLRKLADYLEGLPEGYQHFDMGGFLTSKGDASAVLQYTRRNGGVASCGTVACAVGHGPAAGIFFRPQDFDGGAPDWPAYSDRFATDAGYRFGWAFGGLWDGVDNHHWGAAARIRYLLKHGKPPKGFRSPGSFFLEAYREFDKRYAAQAMSTGTAKTPKAVEGRSPASAVPAGDAPTLHPDTHRSQDNG